LRRRRTVLRRRSGTSHLGDATRHQDAGGIDLGHAVTAPDDLTDVYVVRYLGHARKAADNQLLLAKTVYEAKAKLSEAQFLVFCERVGIKPDGATCSKMKKIGKVAAVLLPHADRLTSNWTTLYKIAKLPKPKLMEVIQSERLNRETTAKEIDEIVGALPRPTTTRSQQGPTILLDLTGLGASEIDEVELEIANLESRFGKSLKVTRIGFSARYPEKHFFQMEINGTIPQLKGGAVHA